MTFTTPAEDGAPCAGQAQNPSVERTADAAAHLKSRWAPAER
jgi:hypothetical protein